MAATEWDDPGRLGAASTRLAIDRSVHPNRMNIWTTHHRAAPSTTDSVDADYERQLDDLDDLDNDDCFELLDAFGMPDELERLGGYSESTAFEEPPPE